MIDLEYYEYEYDPLENDRRHHRRRNHTPDHEPKVSREEIVQQLAAEDDTLAGFEMSYTPARHEREWLLEALGPFYVQRAITDVRRMVKGGKEACVYHCVGHAALEMPDVAAKVYRPRKLRNLRNDALYRHGRSALDAEGKSLVRDSRAAHAITKHTAVGERLRHTSWLTHEYEALRALHAAGVDVPRPLAVGANAVLMEYIGGDDLPAPALSQIDFARDEAERLFARLLWNIERMLRLDLIHADLSAYNVLYWNGALTIIDLPQCVNPHENPHARAIFERDVLRICEYFAAQGVGEAEDAAAVAAELWQRHLGETVGRPPPLPGEEDALADTLALEAQLEAE